MMYEEFVDLSGLNVSYKDYKNIVEPMCISTGMSKQEFIKFISPSVKALVKSYPKVNTIMTKTNKIMVVGTIEVIIDTVDSFLMLHPQATLKDFLTFIERTRANYIKGE